jgi:hypothetical protein
MAITDMPCGPQIVGYVDWHGEDGGDTVVTAIASVPLAQMKQGDHFRINYTSFRST